MTVNKYIYICNVLLFKYHLSPFDVILQSSTSKTITVAFAVEDIYVLPNNKRTRNRLKMCEYFYLESLSMNHKVHTILMHCRAYLMLLFQIFVVLQR